MFEPTGSQRDAASTIFNLSDYRVLDALEVPGHVRRVEVESTSQPGCPTCGVVSIRVHVARSAAPRVAAQVEVVAIDPSAAFRKAIRTHLPCAAVSVDTFYADVLVMPMWEAFGLLRGLSGAVRSA